MERRWYRHQPDRLVETDDIVVMWDTTIPTAGKIKANRQDICLRDKKAYTCLLIDISCPADGNVGRKHAEKLAKYGDLRVEVAACGNVEPRWFPWYWELWAQCTQVLHGGWTLFQVCSTYRKQCFWDPPVSLVKSCLPLFKAMIWSKYPRGSLASQSLLGYRVPFPEVRGWGRTHSLLEPGIFRERHRVTCLPTSARDQLFS